MSGLILIGAAIASYFVFGITEALFNAGCMLSLLVAVNRGPL